MFEEKATLISPDRPPIYHKVVCPQPYSLKKWNLFLYFSIPSEVLCVLWKGTFLYHSAKPTSHSWAANKNENCC